MTSLPKASFKGTHRLKTPEETLQALERHLPVVGVTRLADVSGLDRIGIPVFCAIRPRGRLLQVSNGKGLDPVSAKVSALMEAVEVFHYEHESPETRRASLAVMRREGHHVVEPGRLSEHRKDCFFTEDFQIGWERGEELHTSREVWLPASAVRIQPPMLFPFSSNGLAAGNHLVEATLHALYELIERDAVSRLCGDGRVVVRAPQCLVIDLDTVGDGSVRELIQRVNGAGVKLVLLWVESCIRVHTFWAILLDRDSVSHLPSVNVGYGTHLSPSVAAVRAVTEAAQSRLALIHGAREDLRPVSEQLRASSARLFSVFDRLEPDAQWESFADGGGSDLLSDYHSVLEQMAAAGYAEVLRVDLTLPSLGVPVTRVFVPGLQCRGDLF